MIRERWLLAFFLLEEWPVLVCPSEIHGGIFVELFHDPLERP